jgi:hypothetical protein
VADEKERPDPHVDPVTAPAVPARRGGRGAPENIASTAQAQANAKSEKKRLAQRRLDLRALIGQPAFQRFALRMIDECGVFRAPRVFSAEKQVLEGRREVGLQLWQEIEEIDPEALVRMMRASLTQEY